MEKNDLFNQIDRQDKDLKSLHNHVQVYTNSLDQNAEYNMENFIKTLEPLVVEKFAIFEIQPKSIRKVE